MGFLDNLIKSGAAPIGIDIGSAAIKLAQVAMQAGKPQLTAAASAEVPQELRADARARIEHFIEIAPKLLSQGGFKGRRAVLGLPASCMHLQRVRVPLLEDQAIKQALQFELVDKLPFHPSRALIRHLVAGEVYEENERRNEVIVLAAQRELSDRFLAAATKARIEVVGAGAEPLAIASCLAPPEAKTPTSTSRGYLDIGLASTRLYIATGRRIQFARAINIGISQLDLAVAQQMRVDLNQARVMRLRHLSQTKSAARGDAANSTSATSTATATIDPQQEEMARVMQACREPLAKLIEEIELCLRYHSATFPLTPIEQLVFVGGSAAQRRLCQKVASELHIPAQIGDVFARVPPIDSIDPAVYNTPSPAWVVAVGLSLGSPDKAT
jgi:type IV pilus assembly protein PilM